MASFNPGGQSTRTKYNFVSAFDVHKPDVDPELTMRYGRETLTGLMTMVGNKKVTIGKEFIHHEADRLMPKIKATNGGAGAAGAAVTFTVVAAGLDTINYNNSPHISTDTEQIIPVVVGDVILIKPATGVVSATTVVRAVVTAVTASAGTFVAIPSDSTDAIPAVTTASEIVIYSTAHGEESSSPDGRNSKTIKYTNNVQIFRNSHQITGTEDKIITWFNVVNPDGSNGARWSIKGEMEEYARFNNMKELGLLLGEKITNTTLANTLAPGTPITMTEGLIPFILGGGTVSNYTGGTGWTLNDAESLVLELDKQNGSKHNLLKCGIDLSGQIDRELGDRFAQGGVSYGNFDFDGEKMVSLEYKSFSVMGYNFHKDTYKPFNDLQTLGADGFNFPSEAMVIPMDNQQDAKTRDSIPSLRLRYLEGRENKMSYIDRFDVDGIDRIDINYLAECGFEGFAPNRFAYIKKN